MADCYSVTGGAVSRSSNKTDKTRRAIYDRTRTALQKALRDYEPPLRANEQIALEVAVCRLEADSVFREAS